MDLTDRDNLKIAMHLAGLKARKGLGQHFLVDRDSLDAIMGAGELRRSDTVLEVGPGLGVMTLPLTKEVHKVIAVEADASLAELLEREQAENLVVHHEDILKFNLGQVEPGYKVVANIPYYLTSQLFRAFLESANPPRLMSVLIQKEVAERIVARPGQMSVLAFSVQYYADAEIKGIVERHKFWPPPKVDSAILQARLRSKPAFAADRDQLFRLVKAGFGEKRKQLKNSLAGGLNVSIELATRIISDAKLEPTARAQELAIGDWERLYKAATKHKALV